MSNFPDSTLHRGLFILDCLSRTSKGCAFKELLALCNGTASTTLNRLLKPLVESDHIIKEDSTYRIGPTFITSARNALGSQTIADVVQPLVTELSDRTGDSAAYFQWDGDWIYIAAKHEAPDGLHFNPIGNRSHPLYHCYFQAIHPWLPSEDLEKIGIESDEGFAEIRENGFIDKIEPFNHPHIRMTAPVFYGERTDIAGSIGISIPALTLTDEQRTIRRTILTNIARRACEAMSSFTQKSLT